MAVGYILELAGAKMGLNPSVDRDRKVLLRFLNEAARELYDQADMAGSLMEAAFKVNGDQTISLPYWVGKIRGIRELSSMQVWHLNQMRPRYNQFNWTDMWRNWRQLGKRALQTSVTNQAQGVITVPAVENPPITVSLSGPVNGASLINEDVVMTSTTMQTQNTFLDYIAIKKDRVNNYDVTLSDVDGKVLSVIPNCNLQAMYQVIDVSACPWLPQNTSPFDNYIEMLYKKVLNWLYDDDDEFPAFDYDLVLVNKMMQLYKETEDKVDIATAYDQKATRSAARILEDQNRDTEDMVALVANPHDTMLKRIGTGLRRRYSLYAGRKF